MEHKVISPEKDFEPEIQAKKSDDKLLHPIEEIAKADIYWCAYAYSSPFMPIMDLTFAFDALKKMVRNWLAKKDRSFIKKTDEAI